MFLGIGRDLDHRDRAGNVYCCLAVLPRVGNCTPGSLGLGELTPGDSASQRQGGQAVAPICPADAWTCTACVCLSGSDSSARRQSPAGCEASRRRCGLGRESSSGLGQTPWDLQGP